MITGTQNMSNNSVIEKYCFNNQSSLCTQYGGLYQWNEMMQYTMQQGVQGICPQDWHLPTDEEWKVLEGAVDSQYGIGDPEWDTLDWRGFDAGKNLATTSGWWNNNNGTDLFSFSGLPGGYRNLSGLWGFNGSVGVWWVSIGNNLTSAWIHAIGYDNFQQAARSYYEKEFGFSVRCLKNN
jgi:uncharacterized protein (TIGR02145 family)